MARNNEWLWILYLPLIAMLAPFVVGVAALIAGAAGVGLMTAIEWIRNQHRPKPCAHEWTERARFRLLHDFNRERIKAECIRCFAQEDFLIYDWPRQCLSQWDLEQMARRAEQAPKGE